MSPIRKVKGRTGWGRGKERKNTLRGENEHMASIAFSLLHHQICRILIRTLGFFFFSLLFPSCQPSVTYIVQKE